MCQPKEKLHKFQRTALKVMNLGLIVAALSLTGVLVRRYVFFRPDRIGYLREGSRFPLLNIDWGRHEQTLVMILQTKCLYCDQSEPFYRDIRLGLAGRSDVSLIAVLPDSSDQDTDYFKRARTVADDVMLTSLKGLKEYGLQSTPTLVLVNRAGLITGLWVGKLPTQKESEVLSKLHLPDIRNGIRTIDENELQHLKRSGQKTVLLDLRQREEYARDHLDGSKNIPFDELKVRAINELAPTDFIVLYEGESGELTQLADALLKQEGFTNVAAWRRLINDKRNLQR